MITLAKLNIYEKMNGDIDHFVRVGTKKEKLIIEEKDWFTIQNFLQDLELVEKGLASKDYLMKLTQKLNSKIDNAITIKRLKELRQRM